jgi:hypothetical protein
MTPPQLTDYLQRAALPGPTPAHEFEGRLVRVRGEAAVFYIERGIARRVVHRRLLELFPAPPTDIEREALAGVSEGLPMAAVHELSGGTFILIDGTKRPLLTGLPLTVTDDGSLDDLPLDNRPVHWYPGAAPGLSSRE